MSDRDDWWTTMLRRAARHVTTATWFAALCCVAACSQDSSVDESTAETSPSTAATATTQPAEPPTVSPALEIVGYWDRDLSTPEAAVRELLTELQSGDFVSALLLFDREAQQSAIGSVLVLAPDGLLAGDGTDPITAFRLDDDHSNMGSAQPFEMLMTAAAESGSIAVDVMSADPASLTEVSTTDGTATLSLSTTTGVELEAVTTLSESGRWRVRQLREVGADPLVIPFATSGRGGSTPVDPATFDTVRDELAAESPAEAALLAAGLIEQADFYNLFQLLHVDAQDEVAVAGNEWFRPLVSYEAWRDVVGQVRIGDNEHADHWEGLFDLTMRAAQIAGAGYFDLENARAEVLSESSSEAVVLLTSVGGDQTTVDLVRDSTSMWRVRRLHVPGAPADRSPFGGTAIVTPQGTEDCWEFAGYDCAWANQIDEATEQQIEQIRAMVEQGQLQPADGASQIIALRADGATVFGPEIDVVHACRVLQGLDVQERFDLEVDPAVLVEQVCPGDVSLLTVDP